MLNPFDGPGRWLPPGWGEVFTKAFLAAEKAWWDAEPENYYDCTDSLRIACNSSATELRAYADELARGCCGSVDVILDVSLYGGGVAKVLYGFNHGH